MKIASLLTCTLVLSLSATPFALAETAKSDASTTTVSDDAKKAKSKECSDQADAKGLHGKERKKFREQCKHGK
jgi:psiF repeat